MSTSVAEALPAWMPTRSELLLRPLEKVIAIDPKNPVEIDDAIRVDTISATETRVATFISDIGLIKSETPDLELARKRGWTRYRDDGNHKTMFPENIWTPLGLDQRFHNLGAPAVKIAFSYNPNTGAHGDVDFSKVRVKSHNIDYGTADRLLRRGDETLIQLSNTANSMAAANGFEPAIRNSRSRSKSLVAGFMVMTNFVVASEMEKAEMPWLYRNHGEKALDKASKLSEQDKGLFKQLMKAIYQVDPSEHSGLGLASYCHITSGLRRFADTANGLNLDALIEGEEPPYSHADMSDISDELIEIYRKEIIRRTDSSGLASVA